MEWWGRNPPRPLPPLNIQVHVVWILFGVVVTAQSVVWYNKESLWFPSSTCFSNCNLSGIKLNYRIEFGSCSTIFFVGQYYSLLFGDFEWLNIFLGVVWIREFAIIFNKFPHYAFFMGWWMPIFTYAYSSWHYKYLGLYYTKYLH